MKVKNCCLQFLISFVFLLTNVGGLSEIELLRALDIDATDNIFLDRPPVLNNSYDQPVIIIVNSFLRRLEKIDDKNMDIRLQLEMQLSWVDPRLSKKISGALWPKDSFIKYVTVWDTRKIWTPNVFFTNEKRSPDYCTSAPKDFVRLHRNGSFMLNKRLSVTFDCPMDLRRFPFDVQVCSIQLSNHGDTLKNVQLFWNDNNSVQISTNFHASNFALENFITMTKVIKTNTGEYSAISMDLIFSRNMHFYLMKFYLPVVVTVLISWLPFWLGRVLIIRIYIALISITFLSWHYLAQPNDLIISHFTYLDYWRGINFMFILSAGLESILISYMIKTNKNKIVRKHPDDSEKFKMLQCKDCPRKTKYLEHVDEKTDLDLEIMKIKANFKISFINVHKEVKIIDVISKFFFSSTYCIFIFFYWLRCT